MLWEINTTVQVYFASAADSLWVTMPRSSLCLLFTLEHQSVMHAQSQDRCHLDSDCRLLRLLLSRSIDALATKISEHFLGTSQLYLRQQRVAYQLQVTCPGFFIYFGCLVVFPPKKQKLNLPVYFLLKKNKIICIPQAQTNRQGWWFDRILDVRRK